MRLNIKCDNNAKTITCSGTYKDLLKDIADMREESKWNDRTNFKKFKIKVTNDDRSYKNFSGGEWEDVTNLKNLDPFKKQLNEFRKNKLEEKITTKIGYNQIRKRKLSEHDGDFDLDKQWEIKPFIHTKKDMLPMSVIDMNIDMSINSSMSSESINKYGVLIWSLIQLVESLGIQVKVNLINETTKLSYDDYGGNFIFNIKKSGEYISPIALATCFQSVFYRRAIFSGFIMACDKFKQTATDGLGYPKYQKSNRYIWFDKGAIYTKPGGQFDTDEIVDTISKTIKGEKYG